MPKKPKSDEDSNDFASRVKAELRHYGISRKEQHLYVRTAGIKEPLCTRFSVLGTAVSDGGAVCGALCRSPSISQRCNLQIIPFEALHDTPRLTTALAKLGVVAPFEKYKLRAIASYIHIMCGKKRVRVLVQEGLEQVDVAGVAHHVAVLGNILVAKYPGHVHAALKGPSLYASKGTAKKWCEAAAPILQGNPVLITMLSAALSAPLKHLFSCPLLSVLFWGPSSSGKTTAARFVNTLYGPPRDPYGWAATANGLEALALRHRDAPLVVDEIGEGKAAAIVEATYRLNNGMEKARATTSGGLQEASVLRTVVIAFGEVPLAQHAVAGKQVFRHGVEVRMPSFPVNEEYGCFSTLNSFSNPRALAIQIDRLTQDNYGAVWPCYLTELIHHHSKRKQFIEENGELYAVEIAGYQNESLSSVERRVLAGCVTWALAGEIAIRCDALPLSKGQAVAAVAHCFRKWLDYWRSGTGAPSTAVLNSLRHFFQQHAPAAFHPIANWDGEPLRGCAGYVINHKKHGILYLVFRGYFEEKLCKGFTVDEALDALDKAGLLLTQQGGRSWLKRMPRGEAARGTCRMRFYAIKEAIRFED